jgi:predicted PurR-regulated permease PerM
MFVKLGRGMRDLEEKSFLLLVVAVSLAFAWILWPLSGAILWGTVLAIVFAPLYRRLLRSTRERSNIAALVTVSIILLIVILPLTVIGALVLREASGVYRKVQSGELDLKHLFRQASDALPAWASGLMNNFGLNDLGAVQERLTAELARGSQFLAAQAINIGQNTFEFIVSFFVVLYLLFFLLRDGEALTMRIREAIPLHADQRRALFSRFTTVIRATVKGNIVVAAVQGALGGVIFFLLEIQGALLWGVVMAILSLLPAIGAALIWVPVSLYFLAIGAVWQGVALMAYGVLVISTVDNFLRPLQVGKDTKMPDYLVLVSALGGIGIFGINGLVIGPVIAAMFIAAWDLFSASRREAQNDRAAG